jgi:hypothetical protein
VKTLWLALEPIAGDLRRLGSFEPVHRPENRRVVGVGCRLGVDAAQGAVLVVPAADWIGSMQIELVEERPLLGVELREAAGASA